MEQEKGSYVRFSRRRPLDQGRQVESLDKIRQDLGGNEKTSAEGLASRACQGLVHIQMESLR